MGSLNCEIVLKITIMCAEDRNKSLILREVRSKVQVQVGCEFEKLGSVQMSRDQEKVHLKSQEF